MVEPIHVLEAYDEIDEDFPRHTTRFISELLARAEAMPGETLDERLTYLCYASSTDKAALRFVVPRMIALVGEEIRVATTGHWEMKLGLDGRTREPWIVDQAGEEFAVFTIPDFIDQPPSEWSVQGYKERVLMFKG